MIIIRSHFGSRPEKNWLYIVHWGSPSLHFVSAFFSVCSPSFEPFSWLPCALSAEHSTGPFCRAFSGFSRAVAICSYWYY